MTYSLAGFGREVVCTSMCPWPRLQGAIWDPEAFTVNYRDYRGEPRGSVKKNKELRSTGEVAGDCVDCLQCVLVCPIGIDIRQGPNFACINCGLCVDACDGVMKKLGRSRGLIDYETWANIERGRSNEALERFRLLRPVTAAVALAIVALGGGMSALIGLRDMGGLSVDHERSPLATRLSDGRVRNAYTLRIVNKEARPQLFIVTAEAEGADLQLAVIGQHPVVVERNATTEVRATLSARYGFEGEVKFKVSQNAQNGTEYMAKDRFFMAN
jgi:cytochrome c oxidase accessory protein FixG